jgi:HlyD family secretion protein
MRRVLCGIVVGTFIIGGSIGCSGSPSGAPQQQAAGTPGTAPQKAGGAAAQGTGRVVQAARAIQGQVKQVFTYTGTVQPHLQVNLSPKATGRLDHIMVDVGSVVKAGDVIATLESSSLQLSVQQAQANLLAAQAKLTAVNAGGRSEDIASAQAAVDSAQAKFDQLQNPNPSDMQAAQTAVETTKATLASAQTTLVAAQTKLSQLKSPTQNDISVAQATVDQAQANVKSTLASLQQTQGGAPPATISADQQAIQKAYSDVIAAQDKLEMWKNGQSGSGFTSNSGATEAVASAQQAYTAALDKLKQDQAPLPAALQAAQSAYDSAKSALDSAEAKLNQLKNATPADIQTAQTAVDTAQQTVTSAQASLVSAQTKLTQLQSPTQNDMTVSQATVTQAQQNLAKAKQPYVDSDIQAAQSSVAVANAALASAQGALADATLVAPFDGVITARSVSPGAVVSGATTVATLVSSQTEIMVNVEESRLAQLKSGLSVAISVAAYPGQTISGKVDSISPSADAKSHTFSMKIVPDDPAGKLKAGMYAQMDVTAEEHSGVLVPRDAQTTRNGKDIVWVIADGKAQMRPIVPGLPMGDNVEIASGLKADEQVIVVGYSGLNDGDTVRVAGAPAGSGGQSSPAGQNNPGGQSGPGGTGTPGVQGTPGPQGTPGAQRGSGGQGGQGGSGAPAKAQ